MSELGKNQNAFDLELMQNFIGSLGRMGLAVQTFSETNIRSETTYAAIVMPKQEYDLKLMERNWTLMDGKDKDDLFYALSGQGATEFTEEHALDEETASLDPRYASGDSAWDVLSRAAEMACKIGDGAPEEEYFSLDDTSVRLREFLDDEGLLRYFI
jgi:hypothetical protein